MVRREADLFGVTSIEMLVHALVVPSNTPEDRRRLRRVQLRDRAARVACGKLLALMDKWEKEPGAEGDDAILAELDRARVEDPIRFHDVDLSAWPDDDEPPGGDDE